MNLINQHLDKNNLHHAYLIEGAPDEVVPEITKFLKNLDINTVGNPDFVNIKIDNFKIDEAFDLRSMSRDLGFSPAKKIFIICVNSFSLDAQNVLLKMFEEPIENTHFFLIVPDINALLKILVSRFYLIKAAPTPEGVRAPTESVGEKFITMPLKNRIDFIKELLIEPEEEDEEENEIAVLDSTRSKALKFLNTLEFTLYQKFISKSIFDISFFEHFFKVREFLRMPGSSTKSLMESVALVIPKAPDVGRR
jgi:DNA polymerase III delta prime subunit